MIPLRSHACSSIAARYGCVRRPIAAAGSRYSLRRPVFRAWESTSTTEEKETGHFSVKANESLLFIDNIFPIKLGAIFRLSSDTDRDLAELLRRFDNSNLGAFDPIRLVKRAIPSDAALKVTEIVPRLKDGGAFVKVEHDTNISPADIESTLQQRLEKQPLKPWFNPFRGINARLVRGSPWVEDLYRFPSSLLKVEFVPTAPGGTPAELSEEALYTLFRRYGKIADILPQAWDSKETPRYAQIGFPRIRDAIMARNCLHGLIVTEAKGGGKDGTVLRLSYVRRVKAHSIWNWLTSHPRIVIPIVAALLAGFSVIVFDPIRKWFIKAHVQRSLQFTESRLYKWFKSQTDGFSFGRKKERLQGLNTVWNHRRDIIGQLQGWLDGSSDTFIVVTGPRGSGKAEMVLDQSLAGRKNVLVVDCRPIVDANGEAGTIKRLGTAVGYRPIFSWANSMSSMIDLAVQSTTGVKAGFSETLESQVSKILHTAAAALKEVALSGRSGRDKDATLSEDAFLEAHPERRPVVVIDNFLHKGEDKSIVYDKMAEWAATLVQNKIAHVIFLTSDTAYSKPLSKAMPDRVFRSISLDDLDHNVAKNFVLGRIEDRQRMEAEMTEDEKKAIQEEKYNLTGLDQCIETLGGRLTDLEFLSRRIKAGQSPKQAVDEIVGESATDIVKMFLLPKASEEDKKWSAQQAWHLVKSLAQVPSLRYNQVLLSPAFSASTTASAANGEAALEALASAELISLKLRHGRPQLICAGKPLYEAAFARLVDDRVLRAKMDLAVLSEMAKVEAKGIDAVETELALLGRLPRQTGETTGRVTYLLRKLDASQRKISELELEMGALKKILNEDY
ncbi:Mitochondrial escape protein 2 [Hirsutella minnesotensis 3608]|uniref:Mitochondrial escape protein 2 n=1 Tax=Hirsutella minnesotensis 3608 TaxID=1043627 RepID=A0A0F8A062_9HYPO|nr:Mitochondrial escape protein 2 [Hirsutella minnesotensis 3608]